MTNSKVTVALVEYIAYTHVTIKETPLELTLMSLYFGSYFFAFSTES